jgi:hypothetical protein
MEEKYLLYIAGSLIDSFESYSEAELEGLRLGLPFEIKEK